MSASVRAFIQARMSSSRFPGKVLAPFRGRPLLAHVIDKTAEAVSFPNVVLATSDQPADDPLAAYGATLGVPVFRGPLDDVLGRLQLCLKAHPCSWFFRVCADSPLLDPGMLKRMAGHAGRDDLDLVTNIFPRTFPRGRSAELIAAKAFAALDARSLTEAQREHVTAVYYDNPGKFRILNIAAERPASPSENVAVDTPEDLRRLELAS